MPEVSGNGKRKASDTGLYFSVVRRLPRDPIRFDLANAFAEFGRLERVSLRDAATARGFVERVRGSVSRSLSNEALVHGLRTQAMFGALVVSLGKVDLLKEEDAGEIYASDAALKVPDFRLILQDGSKMLVEVKNFYQRNDPRRAFALSGDYLDGLVRYSGMMGCELFVAVYWARWNIWTLLPPDAFRIEGNRRRVDLPEALRQSQMVRIGDYTIGTKFPLSLLMHADRNEPRIIGPDGAGTFTVSNVEVYCGGRLVIDAVETRIATYLMFYGRWRYESEPKLVGNEIEAVEHRWVPEQDQQQGFEIVGSLSEMFSTFYRFMTQEDGEVTRLQIEVTPGSLGQLIPENHKGDKLPPWRFRMHPAKREAKPD